jgi:hypothetical protein
LTTELRAFFLSLEHAVGINKAEETYLLNPAILVATAKGALVHKGIYEHITLRSLVTLMANNFANFIDHAIRTGLFSWLMKNITEDK